MEKTKNFLLKTLFTLFIVFTVGLLVVQMAHAASAETKSGETKSAGTVTFTSGDTSIIRADKSVVKAAKNDAINVGDTIETKNGRLQLALIDGGKVSLQPNTIYKINKYEFSGKEDGSEYAFTELLKGGMRTISGLIGHKNRERYQLKTAVATIGIRGTEFTVNFNNNQLLMTTNHGSVDVCNAGGCLNAVTGQSIAVAGAGAAPKPSSKAAKAAANAPASSKAVYAAGEEVSIVKVAFTVATRTTPTATTAPLLPNKNNGNNNTSFLSTVMKTACNCGFDGVYDAQIETGNTAKPTKLTIAGSAEIRPIAFSSVNNDGIIGWGRIMPGTLTNAGVSNSIEWMDYAIGAKPDPAQLANLTGTYTVFGSTAPMLLAAGNVSTTIGNENAVTGNFTFNFGTSNYNYNLNVVTVGVNYGLSGSGSALLAANPMFQTGGLITGGACSVGTCSGALENGNLIQGAFFGQNGERIGLQYGFDVSGSGVSGSGGQIYGTAVLK